MEEPGDAPSLGIVHDRIEPLGLQRLLALAAPEEQRIEPDKATTLGVLHPPVGAEIGAPALKPFLIDRLMVVAGIADIMIAGHGAKPHAQIVHQLRGVLEVLLDIGAVNSDVAGMDNEVGMLLDDPAGKRSPISSEMRLVWTQVSVGKFERG
jgi:hypothetical protein